MTTVANLIRCLQQHDPNAIVMVQGLFGVLHPLHVKDISAVALREREGGGGLYVIADDDVGTPGVVF